MREFTTGNVMGALCNNVKHGITLAMICLLLIAGSADPCPAASSATGLDQRKDRPEGFLSLSSQIDSIGLLPAPPAGGTAAYAADEEAYRVTRALRGTPRWAQAVEDANLDFPAAAETFSGAIGVKVSKKETPRLYNLLLRTKTDAYRSTGAAKKFYHRLRPFVVNDDATCTPADDPFLRKSGSYPSAHSTTGWTWALVLAELVPDRADAILKRGLDFGRSRVICGAHWQSDVAAGRIIGAGVVARLHADPVFRAELAAARSEIQAARAGCLKPVRNPLILTRPAQWAQPMTVTGVPNLYQVSDTLYRSAQPTAEGMKNLQRMGIRTIVNLRSFHSDRDELGKTGLAAEHIYMKAWHPEREEVIRFLRVVTDPARMPVLVHCQHGADRTGTMSAMYRIAVQGWTKEEALREMTEGGYGFHAIWKNLPPWIADLDIESLKRDAGITSGVEK